MASSSINQKADRILAEKNAKLLPANIKKDTTIFDVTGTFVPTITTTYRYNTYRMILHCGRIASALSEVPANMRSKKVYLAKSDSNASTLVFGVLYDTDRQRELKYPEVLGITIDVDNEIMDLFVYATEIYGEIKPSNKTFMGNIDTSDSEPLYNPDMTLNDLIALLNHIGDVTIMSQNSYLWHIYNLNRLVWYDINLTGYYVETDLQLWEVEAI